MKTVVSFQEINELEIKPYSEVSEWRRLVESDIDNLWDDRSSWVSVACPCCSVDLAQPAFNRIGVAYVECSSCGTVYASERPDEVALISWYRDSSAARFWRESMLVASRDIRYEKIVLPRLQWVIDSISEYVPNATRLLDVSSNGRPLVDAIVSEIPDLKACVAGQAADLEAESRGRVSVEPTPVDRLPGLGPVNLVIAIDALDRASDFTALLRAAHNALTPGGILFATVVVASGFEIQALWDRSPTVLPPDKLNLPTVRGLLQVFDKPFWELLELSTPGMFDVEVVRGAMADGPGSSWPRILRSLVDGMDTEDQRSFTQYLQSRRLSSFARLVARRLE